MGLSASLVLPVNVKTEIFLTPVAEFKEMAVQSRTTNLTVMELHPSGLEV